MQIKKAREFALPSHIIVKQAFLMKWGMLVFGCLCVIIGSVVWLQELFLHFERCTWQASVQKYDAHRRADRDFCLRPERLGLDRYARFEPPFSCN